MRLKSVITVDEVGRLVLPKEVREAIGVFGRMSLQVEVIDNAARISAPEAPPAPLRRKGKRMVYGAKLPADWDSGEAVLNLRERRVRR